MTTEKSNSRIVGPDEAEIACSDSDPNAQTISRHLQGLYARERSENSPRWAWANCRSGFDWMDVHLPFFTEGL